MPFQKGQSGNPGGRSKSKPISDMYRQVIVQNPEKLRKLCEKVLDMACAGDVIAAKEITDRVEGRALQSVDVNDSRESLSSSLVLDLLREGAQRADKVQ